MKLIRLFATIAALFILSACNDSALPPGATYAPVSGVVIDRATNQPVANATVTIDVVLTRTTGPDGKFTFPSVPVGDFGYTVAASGYSTTQNLTGHVDASGVTSLTIKLDAH
jgi:hypothetical protein